MICLTHTSVVVLSGKEALKVWHTNHFYKCFLKEKNKHHIPFVAPVADWKPAVCQLLSEGEEIPPREQLLREGRTVTAWWLITTWPPEKHVYKGLYSLIASWTLGKHFHNSNYSQSTEPHCYYTRCVQLLLANCLPRWCLNLRLQLRMVEQEKIRGEVKIKQRALVKPDVL